MHIFRNKFFQSVIAIFVVYIGIVVLISQSPAGDAPAIDKKLIAMSSDNRLEVLLQITSVNPLEGTANARVLPWPNSDDIGYQFKSGWVPNEDITLHVDSVIGASNGESNQYQFTKDVPAGGFDVQIDEQPGAGARSSVNWYPLDFYSFEIPVSAYATDSKGVTSSVNLLPLDYTKNVDTFDIKMTHGLWADANAIVNLKEPSSFNKAIDEFNQGFSSSVFTAHRSQSTKLLVVIILLLMITAMTSVTIMTNMVTRGMRPPTLASLTWAAALTYSLISLRGLMPGSPPIGIFVDKVVYFPSLIVTLVCSLWILLHWSRREDFQA